MRNEYITIKDKNTLHQIPKNDIAYCKIYGDCLTIYTLTGTKHRYCSSLKSFITLCNNLIQINRNTAINYEKIRTFCLNERTITLANDEKFEVSHRRIKNIRDMLVCDEI